MCQHQGKLLLINIHMHIIQQQVITSVRTIMTLKLKTSHSKRTKGTTYEVDRDNMLHSVVQVTKYW